MSEGLTVLIADDHPPTRAGVRLALEEGEFIVCAEAGDAEEAVATALREAPAVCLLDINMPGHGIEAAKEISAKLPGATVVMLTVSRDDADLFAALQAGASGYLLKDIDPARLPVALRAILAGEAVLPLGLVNRLVDEFRHRGRRGRFSLSKTPGAELTEREWEVLEFLREGLSTAEIAERLFVSPVTVRTHVSAILKKLQVPDRESAVKLLQDGR